MNKNNARNLASFLALLTLLLAVRPALAQSPPELLVDIITDTQLRLSWTNTATGFVVEEVDDLAGVASWSPVLQAPQLASQQFSVIVSNTTGAHFFRLTTRPGGLPPDPTFIASPAPIGIATLLAEATSFLYTGPNPIQTGVAPGTIETKRAAVVRGRVRKQGNASLSGVTISILNHPEFGQTFSRADGMFDLAVNGGGLLAVKYEMAGFCPVQRQINVPWQDYVIVQDVVMTPFDTAATTVDLSVAAMQVARGSAVIDADGARRATILFPPGTSASLIMPNGATQTVGTVNIRATEYTVGSNGPAAMPGPLPPSSGYTYCAEFSVDEAIAAGATEVRFSQALPVFVENFLDFPVGTPVPAGYYDRQKGQWIPSTNGRVIKILSITANRADLDLDGNASADDAAALAALGVTDEERAHLAQLYTPGQTLWRVPITHFSAWDFNWPFGPPPGAVPPPTPTKKNNPAVDNANEECGSVVGCEDQTLGESIPLTGTSWRLHYKSDRMPGRITANSIKILVSGATPLPAGLKRIELEISVAGQHLAQTFPAAPNQIYTFTWDGKDAFGRSLYGAQPATISIRYVYGGVYLQPSEKPGSDYDTLFGHFSYFGTPVSGNRERAEVTLLTTWTEPVGPWHARALGMGGWSLSLQHAYDPTSRALMLGNGRQRRADAITAHLIIATVAGTGRHTFSGDGGLATAADLNYARSVAVSPDGSLLIADTGNQRIRRVAPDGIITTVAGNGVYGFSGDGGPATAARLFDPNDVALSPDGSLLIADFDNNRIRRVGLDGIITTVAGNGVRGIGGDGGLATEAQLNNPDSIAVGPDGSLFISEVNRVRRVGLDGIISTVVGDGNFQSQGDGGPAAAAQVAGPHGIAFGPDGAIFIAEYAGVRRIEPGGIISRAAGTGNEGYSGDGGPATAANLGRPSDVAVGADGSLFIADFTGQRVRRVRPDGIITTFAGKAVSGAESSGDGGPATEAQLNSPTGVALGPDGRLYVADYGGSRIRRIDSALPGVSTTDIVIPAEDGAELYVFNSRGRHLKTLDALTGALRVQFTYSTDGYLISVTDASGNVTTVERNGAIPTAIVAPGGQRTALAVSADGWLLSASNPANEAHSMSYSADGLLRTFTDPRTNIHRFTYDSLGRLTKDEDPAGGSTTLARTEQSNGYTVTTTSALGRTHVYQVEQLPTGTVRRTVTAPSGTQTITVINIDGSEQTTYADGGVATIKYGPDPRWGMLTPVPSSVSIQNAGGLTATATITRTATLADPNNLLSLATLTDSVTINGSTFMNVYDSATRTVTATSAAGRQRKAVTDFNGRIIQSQVLGLQTNFFAYDTRGFIGNITQGTGPLARAVSLSYNPAGDLDTVTDPLGRTLGYTYNAAGRATLQTLPDGRSVAYGYDANGNRTSVTPPGRSAHGFASTPINQISSYTPPDVGIGSTATLYTYNADRALTRIARPDGQFIDFGYELSGGCSCGRLSTMTIPTGIFTYTYDAATDNLTGTTTPDGGTLSYTYTGALLTQTAWAGTVAGNVGSTYDNDFRVNSLSVNGTNAIAFQYDRDSLLTNAGSLTLSRNAQNGLLTATTLGNATDSWDYDSFGEVTNYRASYSGAEVFQTRFSHDNLGRITTKTETVEGTTSTFEYAYDLAGRLKEVTKNGTITATYAYDGNGNRMSAPGLSTAPLYDEQDRLIQYGGSTHSYTANGELKTKASGALVTSYNYDVLGNLMQVTLPGGATIDYVVDGRNRRIGKKINGALVQGFLYQDRLKPIVELDGANTVVSRFVYGTQINVPDYMIKGGETYRILTDHLGSPRLVVDVTTGTVAQRMDYDEFGNVTADTNPGFQPFGFAGGLYDRDTKLVRFGARDYDAETGRWVAKDPRLFEGGDANLYAYVANDPVNWIDPSGLSGVCVNRGNARLGDPLYVKSKDTRLLDAARAEANTVRFFQPDQEVIFRGVDPTDSRFIQVEQGGKAGYILRQNLTPQDPATVVLPEPVGKPMSPQAFSSSGAGTKA